MYTPPHFEEKRIDVLHALARAHPLGALVAAGPAGLDADHIPFEIAAPGAGAPLGTLRAHVARANPLWRLDGAQVLVLFQGPSAYVSPSLFEEKAASGKVVPTWNYAVVHAHGRLRAVDDPAWLLPLLGRLTAVHEGARAQPWSIGDAARDYIDALAEAVVGIEIVIERLEGKWKASQNRPRGDRERIAAELASNGESGPMGRLMAAMP